jgi:hypothetical protein
MDTEEHFQSEPEAHYPSITLTDCPGKPDAACPAKPETVLQESEKIEPEVKVSKRPRKKVKLGMSAKENRIDIFFND